MASWVAFVTPEQWAQVLQDGGASPIRLPHGDAPSPGFLQGGDLLLCYVENDQRWVGALRVEEILPGLGRPSTDEPVSLQILPIAAVPAELGTALGETPTMLGRDLRVEAPIPDDAVDEIIRKLYESGGAWAMAGPPEEAAVGEEEEANGGGQRAEPPEAETELTRTPHLDVPDSVKPGEKFQVVVFADTKPARKGERSKEITIRTPAGVESVELSVWLSVSAHFELTEKERIKPFPIVIAEDETERVSFEVGVKAKPPSDGPPPAITAHFAYKGRRAGSVGRGLEIDDSAPQSAPRLPRAVVTAEGTAAEPDLTVHVTAASLGESARFTCVVFTPHLDDYRTGKEGPWELPEPTGELVRRHMASFTDAAAPAGQLTNRLRGAGVELFKRSPKVFQEAFWALVDGGKPLRTIAVNSQEPYVPWELMVPRRRGDRGRPPLGVSYSVGRWVATEGGSPPQQIALRDGYVVAPRYQGARNFDNAAAETDLVCRIFGGRAIDPASWTGLNDALVAGGASLFHFICHGDDEGQSLRLSAEAGKNEDGKLTLAELEDWPAAEDAFEDHRPLVFLNACEVGRLAPSLLGTDGFAARFADLGASCVIAPLWSVEDGAAHEVAELFYEAVEAQKQNASPATLASILSEIREKAYDGTGRDTHAAYCFYGDPLAVAASA